MFHGRPKGVTVLHLLRALVFGLFAILSTLGQDTRAVLRGGVPDPLAEALSRVAACIESRSEIPDGYQRLLDLYLSEERDGDAKAYFERLSVNPRYRQNSHWMLAKIDAIRGDDAAAFDHYRDALAPDGGNFEIIFDFLEFDRRTGGRFGAMAVLKSGGRNVEAVSWAHAVQEFLNENYDEAVRLLERNPARRRFSPGLLDFWGQCLFRASMPARADSVWRQGLVLARRERCGSYESLFLTELGALETSGGRFTRALALLDSAETIARATNNLGTLHKIFSRRASVYARTGGYRQSLRFDEEAIHAAERIHADRDLADWVFNNAQILYSTGRFFEALRSFDRCESLYKRFKIEKQIVEVNFRKAGLFLYLNQVEIARNLFEKAYRSASEYGLAVQQREISTELAQLMIPEKKYAEARRLLADNARFFELRNDILYCSYCLAALGEAYQGEGLIGRAVDSYSRACAYAKKAGSESQYAWLRLSLARLRIIQKREEEAIAACLPIVPWAASEKDDNLLLNTYLCLGKAFRLHGDIRHAVRYDRLAVDIAEKVRQNLELEPLQIGYFSTVVEASRELALCTLRRYEDNPSASCLDSLLFYLEMGRARSIAECDRRRQSNRRDAVFNGMVKTLRMLQRQIRMDAPAAPRQDSLQQKLQAVRYSLVGQLLKPSERGMRRRSEKSPRIWSKTMQNRLKRNNEGLVVYLISDDVSFALGANGETVQLVRLNIRSAELKLAVDSLVAPFHGAEKTFHESIVFRAGIAHRLYQKLLQPVESAMALPGKVIIVPDLQMANLPFEIMLSAPPVQKEYTLRETLDCPALFLLQRYCFSYAPSVSVLVRKERPSRRYPGIAVFSNPVDGTPVGAESRSPRTRPGWRLAPLPFSDVEARGIRNVCRRTHVFKRSDATKEAFYREASKRQILHFATHAFVDPAFDDFSGLVMAAGSDSTDDGLLMGYEIADLSLKCDLVALSACETGCGRFVEGEGVLGIPRLFLKSGVQSVLMTLWKVDDRFASVLMPRFYGGWLNGGLSKTSALCGAKRAILSDGGDPAAYAHPFYWASFVLYGDPGPEHSGLPAGRPMIAAVWGFAAGLILLAGWRFYFRRGEPAHRGKNRTVRRHGTGP